MSAFVDDLKRRICHAFCGGVTVRAVGAGYAVGTLFTDNSGDRIGFYLTPDDDGYRLEDDGSYLAQLVARDIPIDRGTRGQLLEAVLADAGAWWDKDSYEICTEPFALDEAAGRMIGFLGALIRVRDLELLTRENVASTFRGDALAMITQAFANVANIASNVPVTDEFDEFPADIVLTPKDAGGASRAGAIYLVNTPDKLNEALLLQMESQASGQPDFSVIGLIEEPEMKTIGRRKFQRAQNRSLAMPIFRGDERAAMAMIGRKLSLKPADLISAKAAG